MREGIAFALQIITVDFFIAFSLYSFLYILLSIFIKKPILEIIDIESNKLISFIGILYLFIWLFGTIIVFGESNSEEQSTMLNRIFGKYWFGYWTQPVLWISVTQLLRLRKVRKNILLRVIISFILMISIERFTIILISLHRDYLPSSWTMYSELEIYPSSVILGILFKIFLYLILTGMFYGLNRWFSKILSNQNYR